MDDRPWKPAALAAALILCAVVGLAAAPRGARAQAITVAALDQRSLSELQGDRDRIGRLIEDIEDGDTYIVDPTLGFEGTTSGNVLRLPVPVDREHLSWTITASMIELGAPGQGAIEDYVRALLRANRETVERLGAALRQFDDAIRRKEAGAAPRLAQETHFDPDDPGSVEAYLSTTWRLSVQNAYGEVFGGNLRIEYIQCEPPDDIVPSVSCDFNGVLNVGEGSFRVQNGMYIGGEMRMVVYFDGANATMEGVLSPEAGEIAGSSIRLVGPAAAELAEMGVRSDGTWRAYR